MTILTHTWKVWPRNAADALLKAHTRVREASHVTGVRYRVEPHLPVDVLGIYVLLPVVQ